MSKAKLLLKESADGLNPFEDYEAIVPEGESLSFDGEGTMPFSDAEQKGIEAMVGATFVLVAGGLGERLGYSGICLFRNFEEVPLALIYNCFFLPTSTFS